MSQPRWAIGLGGNIEPRLGLIRRAVAELRRIEGLRVIAVSPVYECPAWGGVAQADFLNAAALCESARQPLELLGELQAIEIRLGREPLAERPRWGPRPIDLDLLLVEGTILDSPRLTLPHPRLLERAFALRPLLDVWPEAVDPRSGRPLAEAFAALEPAELRRFRDPEGADHPAGDESI